MTGGSKDLVFSPKDLMNLLTHYSDGQVPLGGEVTDFLVHKAMHRKIGLLVESDEWDTPEPLFVFYDGKRIATWTKDGKSDRPEFAQMNETPRRIN